MVIRDHLGGWDDQPGKWPGKWQFEITLIQVSTHPTDSRVPHQMPHQFQNSQHHFSLSPFLSICISTLSFGCSMPIIPRVHLDCQIRICCLSRMSALRLWPAVSVLQLLQSRILSHQPSKCVPAMTPSGITHFCMHSCGLIKIFVVNKSTNGILNLTVPTVL